MWAVLSISGIAPRRHKNSKVYTYVVTEMELLEKRGANPNREGETPHNGNNSNNSITSAKLLKGVKHYK